MLESIGLHIVSAAFTFGWTFPITIFLEFMLPHRDRQPMIRLRAAAIWAIYFVLTGTILAAEAQFLKLVPLDPVFTVKWAQSGWILPIAGTLLGAVLFDFFYYWTHRAQHTPLLWRLHAVHHGIRDLNAVNSYHHWTEELVRLPLIGFPLAFLVRMDVIQSSAAAAIIVLHSGYVHSACRVHFPRWLLAFVADNRFHRIHHSIEDRHHGKNYSVFTTIWDRVFGTAYFGTEWPETGVRGLAETDGIASFLLARKRLADEAISKRA